MFEQIGREQGIIYFDLNICDDNEDKTMYGVFVLLISFFYISRISVVSVKKLLSSNICNWILINISFHLPCKIHRISAVNIFFFHVQVFHRLIILQLRCLVWVHCKYLNLQVRRESRIHCKQLTLLLRRQVQVHWKQLTLLLRRRVRVHCKQLILLLRRQVRVHCKQLTLLLRRQVQVHWKQLTLLLRRRVRVHCKQLILLLRRQVRVHCKQLILQLIRRQVRVHWKQLILILKRRVRVHCKRLILLLGRRVWVHWKQLGRKAWHYKEPCLRLNHKRQLFRWKIHQRQVRYTFDYEVWMNLEKWKKKNKTKQKKRLVCLSHYCRIHSTTNCKALMQPSIGTLNAPSWRVVKDSTPSRRRVLRYIHFGIGESWLILFLDLVNLHLIIFEAWWILNGRAFYCFITFFVWKWILT